MPNVHASRLHAPPTPPSQLTITITTTTTTATTNVKVKKVERESARNNPDGQLPHAQTCFFSINLPQYSSKEVCKERLLYAIANAPNMDGDYVDHSGAGWDSTIER